MIKEELENFLIQVLEEKKTDSHPCLEYVTRQLCFIFLAFNFVVSDDEKNNRLNARYLASCEIYKEFKKGKSL